MPGGKATIAYRGRERIGGTTNNSSNSFSFSFFTPSKYSFVVIRKNKDNFGEYHTLNNP
jgi:hypothetical protein